MQTELQFNPTGTPLKSCRVKLSAKVIAIIGNIYENPNFLKL